jgi:hypothetical protein
MAALSTLAIASLATAAVGTGVAVYGQVQQAKTAKKVGEYNAKTAEENAKATAEAAEYNALAQEEQALQTEMDSRENIRRKRLENRRFQSTQRARFAKAGVTEEGSPLEVMADTAALLEMDAQEVNRQAQIEAARLRAGARETRRTGLFQSDQFTKQAGFERMYGSRQASAAYIGAGATLLSGASNMMGSAAMFKKVGA